MKATGVVTASMVGVAAGGTATAADSGYGAGGYGGSGFGGTEEDSTADVPPQVDELNVSEAGSSNDDAELTVAWTVSDANGDLDAVSLTVFDGRGSVGSETVSVAGASASQSTEFRIVDGAGEGFYVLCSASDAGGREASKGAFVAC